MINFKTKTLRKNFTNAFKASLNAKYPKRVIINTNHPMILPRDKNVNKYINLILSEIMSNEIILNNFPKEFIEEKIVLILEWLHINLRGEFNKEKFNKNYDEFLISLESEINETIKTFDYYESIFPIDNLNLESNLKIGDVEFFVMKDIDKFLNNYDKFKEDLFFKHFFIVNQVYAKTTVYGSKDYSNNKAENDIKIALNILKLFVDIRFANFNLNGSNYDPHNLKYITSSVKSTYLGSKSYGGIYSYNCTNEEISKFKYDLDYLSNMFRDENRSDFENRLLTSIFWFGEAISVKMRNYNKSNENKHNNPIENFEFFETYPCLLNLVIALESVFVWKDGSKSEEISSNVSRLIAKPDYEEEIKNFLKDIYKMRSKVVHSGITFISKKDLKQLIWYTRVSLIVLISINREYYHEIIYFNKKYCN